MEVVNDTNNELINFYRVAKNRFHELQSLVRITLHSRSQHDDAWIIYNKPHLFDEVRRAWAIWVLCSQSFSGLINGSWGYDKADNTTTHQISSKRDTFLEDIAIRLQDTQIESADAIYIISSRDTKDSFFYCDPPYYNANCGHYDGYSQQDFENLLKCLSAIKGKFLLSSYPSPVLTEYTNSFNWNTWTHDSLVNVNPQHSSKRYKTEVLTANYPLISRTENELQFDR